MKRISALMVLTILALTFNACSDDDNTSGSNNPPSGKAVITVNTASLYNELNAVEDINDGLTIDSCFIEETVLVYDANGSLVTQMSKETRQVEPLTFEAGDLPYGTYTLIAIQRLAYHGYTLWELVDVDKLSTVHIDIVANYPVLQNALGITSEKVVVEGSDIEATLTPKSVVSVFELFADGMKPSRDIATFSLYAKPKTTGIYLNPDLSESECRYCGNDSTYLNVIKISTASAVNGQLRRKFYTLNNGGNHAFSLYRYNSEGKGGNVTVYNPYFKVGKETLIYYDFNDWNLNWQFCDFTENFDSWKKEKDEAPLILSPCMDWGCSLDDLLHFMSSYKGWYYNKTKGTLVEHGTNWDEIFQIGINHYVYYGFSTQDGQNLNFAYYTIKVEDLPDSLLTNSLKSQGYVYLKMEEENDVIVYYYQTADQKTCIEAGVNKNGRGWDVVFYPKAEAAEAKALRKSKVRIPNDDTSRFPLLDKADNDFISILR